VDEEDMTIAIIVDKEDRTIEVEQTMIHFQDFKKEFTSAACMYDVLWSRISMD
jgi:hypothetical protein